MEFHEKLQELRKQRGMTQEELATALYVSRTAVSKWESGRGYPSIDSLKAISVFFGVSLDQLLSSEAVLTLAEEDSKEQESRTRSLVFGALDCCTGMLLLLGGFYILVLGAYLLFEALAVNYRPILIDGYLEASYPSSTTLLALCVIPTGMLQLHARLQSRTLRRILLVLLGAITGFMVIGRLLSGVHWLTDIIGGVLLSAGLVLLYQGLSGQTLTR